jgi:methyl-accepting chemotaxis protein
MTKSGNRRRAFAATSSLQYRFLAMILVYGFVIVSFLAIAVFAPDLFVIQDQSLSLQIRGFAASRLLAKNTWVWPAAFSLVLLLGVHSFLAFQKIMGPLYRFRCAFEALGEGEFFYPVKIRKRDYLHAEEEALQAMITSLSGKLKQIQEAADEVLVTVGRLEQTAHVGTEWSDAQIELLRANRERLQQLATVCTQFRLEKDAGELQPPSPSML